MNNKDLTTLDPDLIGVEQEIMKEMNKRFGDRTTYLSEQRYYWNREFYSEVESFLKSVIARVQDRTAQEAIYMITGLAEEMHDSSVGAYANRLCGDIELKFELLEKGSPKTTEGK